MASSTAFCASVRMASGLRHLLFLMCIGFAQPGTAGGVRIDLATASLADHQFTVAVSTTFSLDEDVTEALDSGITLTFEIETLVLRQRRLWPDAKVAGNRRLFALSRHALSERYSLLEVDSAQTRTFQTIDEALAALGQWTTVLRCADCPDTPRTSYVARARFRLLTDQLPAPMRPLVWISPGWWVSTGWHEQAVAP